MAFGVVVVVGLVSSVLARFLLSCCHWGGNRSDLVTSAGNRAAVSLRSATASSPTPTAASSAVREEHSASGKLVATTYGCTTACLHVDGTPAAQPHGVCPLAPGGNGPKSALNLVMYIYICVSKIQYIQRRPGEVGEGPLYITSLSLLLV